MFIALLVMMIGLDCYVMCDHISKENKKDTKFEYMYTYKYPDKKVPKGGDACFVKGLHKEVWGYNLEISLIRIKIFRKQRTKLLFHLQWHRNMI